jgi:dihydroorotate dehydrogenase
MADVTMGKITQINLGDRFIPCNIVLPLTTKMSANFTLAEHDRVARYIQLMDCRGIGVMNTTRQ